jgi:alpha/beta superfamily hydrolase
MTPVCIDGCFGWLHMPATASRSTAVLICPGLKYDDVTSYPALRMFAEQLAEAGIPVLRLHYHNTGNSAFSDEADLPAVWQRDIHAAVDWLRRTVDPDQIILCGFRFGALLATTVAAHHPAVSGLILLDPVIRGRTHVRQLLIEGGQTLALEPASHDGYSLPPETIRSVKSLDLRQVDLPPHCRVSLFPQKATQVVDQCEYHWRDRGVAVFRGAWEGLEPLLRPAFASHEAAADFANVMEWIRTVLPAAGPTARRDVPEAKISYRSDDCSELPLFFGPSDRRFGVLCRPATPAIEAVVLIGAGNEPHCTSVMVDIARCLAGHGVASFRFDFSGLGDSLAACEGPVHAFETDRTGEFSLAIDAMKQAGFAAFAVAGVCSGAYHAYRASMADPRVKAAVLINMPLFHWPKGFPIEELTFTAVKPADVIRKLRAGHIWWVLQQVQKVRTGRFRMSRLSSRQAFRFLRIPGTSRSREPARRQAKALFLVGEGHIGIEAIRREFGSLNPPGVETQIHPEISHGIGGHAGRMLMADRIAAYLQKVVWSSHHERVAELSDAV